MKTEILHPPVLFLLPEQCDKLVKKTGFPVVISISGKILIVLSGYEERMFAVA